MQKTLLAIAALAMTTAAIADTQQTLTVNGSVMDAFATGITFNGDNLTLTFEDGTSLTADMAAVSLVFTYTDYSTPNGISEIKAETPSNAGVYSLGGQFMGKSTSSLPKGIYIVNGKKVVVK